ncbi:CidA/LrgA family protein [Caenorhabditis elegans]|uniref:CidA/LrgA family protein n=1 Tax=Caenorhabditis elegans TaxID=6239 RepID=N1NTK5_CAEEL|nr:CidA/LrgA family protein [Caenorhabditis elegans]CCW45985.1 CidA/LrgA family protein [Caenorhabditis elegans]|eukprot:NP_001294077.1 Uncharacterized protein CELE_ZK792.12 [Caenorhabditis elegans]
MEHISFGLVVVVVLAVGGRMHLTTWLSL